MNTCKSLGLVVTMLCCVLAGCGATTRLAVKNEGESPIDVEASKDGDKVTFSAVAGGTTSEFKEVEWEDYSGVTVTTGSSTHSVDLTDGEDNTLKVDANGDVTVEHVYNEENAGW